MKLYLVKTYQAYEAYAVGVKATFFYPNNTAYYKHEILNSVDCDIDYQPHQLELYTTETEHHQYTTTIVTPDGKEIIHKWQ